jgi:hypothetical protein
MHERGDYKTCAYLFAKKVMMVESIPPLKRTANLAFPSGRLSVVIFERLIKLKKDSREPRNITDLEHNASIELGYQIINSPRKILRNFVQSVNQWNIVRSYHGVNFSGFVLH